MGVVPFVYVTTKTSSRAATIAMIRIQSALDKTIAGLSDQNYEKSFAFLRLWFEIAHTHSTIPPDAILHALQTYYRARSLPDNLIDSAAHLILRFASDAELDHILAPHSTELRSRLCAEALRVFFDTDLATVYSGFSCTNSYYADANIIAHCVNLGWVEEAVIRNHILQSLISHPTLYNRQVYTLVILFRTAGATFAAYTDPAVIDRCFEILKGPRNQYWPREKLIQVNALCEGSNIGTEMKFQEVIELRERGWEGLPPPPVFRTWESKSTGTNEKDPAATPVVTSLGLPNRDPEPEITHPLQSESVVASEPDTVPGSPVTQSPSISIVSLSDFTIADASDDESPLDPTVITPHDTFYFEDGSVEVLCGNTLFRVHTGILLLHSPVLGQMFAKANLTVAESPNGCPRIVSSDTATDFATLLKVICLPGYATPLLYR